ncbi:MAG: YqhV family protein [Candidatus Desulforudis sp.]|nr:YqhV family protein [Desulforudis sp.]
MDKIAMGMAAVRFLSATIEFSAAMLMLYFGRVETAFKINAALALVGPTILLVVTSLGLIGLAGKLSPVGMVYIAAGVGLIFLGLRNL